MVGDGNNEVRYEAGRSDYRMEEVGLITVEEGITMGGRVDYC